MFVLGGFFGLYINSTSVFESWLLNFLRFPVALLSHTRGAGIPSPSVAKACPHLGVALPDRTVFPSQGSQGLAFWKFIELYHFTYESVLKFSRARGVDLLEFVHE